MILEIWLYNIDISAQRPNQASCSWFVSTPIKSRFFNSKLCFKKSIGVGIWYIFIFVCVLHWNAQLLRFPLAGCIKSFSPLRGAPVELIYTTICKGVSNHFSKYSPEKMPDHCLPSKNLPDWSCFSLRQELFTSFIVHNCRLKQARRGAVWFGLYFWRKFGLKGVDSDKTDSIARKALPKFPMSNVFCYHCIGMGDKWSKTDL